MSFQDSKTLPRVDACEWKCFFFAGDRPVVAVLCGAVLVHSGKSTAFQIQKGKRERVAHTFTKELGQRPPLPPSKIQSVPVK